MIEDTIKETCKCLCCGRSIDGDYEFCIGCNKKRWKVYNDCIGAGLSLVKARARVEVCYPRKVIAKVDLQ